MEQLFQRYWRIAVNRLLNWFETWKSFQIVGNWKYLLLNTLYSPGSELLRNGSVSGGGEGGMVHPGLDTAAHIPPMFNNWGSVQVHYLHYLHYLHTIYNIYTICAGGAGWSGLQHGPVLGAGLHGAAPRPAPPQQQGHPARGLRQHQTPQRGQVGNSFLYNTF